MSRRIIFWVNIVFVALGDPSFSFEFVLFLILFFYIFFVSFVSNEMIPSVASECRVQVLSFCTELMPCPQEY